MESKPVTSNQPKFVEKKSILFWCMMTIIMLIFFISPFSRGLFNGYSTAFDTAIMTFQCVLFGLGVVFAFYLARRNPNSLRSDATHWVIWILPIMYLIAALTNPASSYQSFQAVNIQLGYSLALVIGLYLSRTIFSKKILLSVILGSGAVIIIFGFMNWFGDASLWGLLNWNLSGVPESTYHDAVIITPDGARLTSVFQYGNSYAAYLIALIVSFLVIAVYAKKTKHVFFSSLILVPAIISLLLTLSRGGILVFPIIVLVTLPFMKWNRQLLAIGYLAITGIISLLILNPITNLGTELQQQFVSSNAFEGWGILIAASFGVALIHALLHFVLTKRIEAETRMYWKRIPLNAVIPLGLVVFGGIMMILLFSTSLITNLLRGHIKERIDNINFAQHSVLERGTFYADAWKVVKDYPLFGAGGGSWASLYEKYQNNPYISNQTHNYFMQLLVEVGIIGLIAAIFLFASVFYLFVRSYWKKQETERPHYLIFFVIALSIILHSVIDFNMSYIYLSLLVFLSLGGMLAIDESKPFHWQEKLSTKRLKHTYPIILLVLCILMAGISANNLSSNHIFKEAKIYSTQGVPFNTLIKTIDGAINKLKHPEYVNLKVQLFNSAFSQTNDVNFSNEAEALLASATKREPFFKPFILSELQLLILKNDYVNAAKLLEDNIPNYPWDIDLYSELATVYFQSGVLQLQEGNIKSAQQEWNLALQLQQQVLEKAVYLETLPEAQNQGREFGITPDFALSLGQIAYFQGDYVQAEQYLGQRVDSTFDDSKDFEAATYYVVTLRKQHKDDTPILQQLLAELSEDNQKQVLEQIEVLMAQNPVTNS